MGGSGMAFENVLVRLSNGQQHGPVPWETLKVWVHQNRIPADAILICQSTQQEQSVASFPDLAGLPRDDTTATLIPYRNMPALLGYYLGVFSLSACIPILGLVGIGMGIAAVVLGIKGLRNANANPTAKGTVHAWIAIVCGTIFTLAGVVINVAVITAIAYDAAR
jgi:hypothetical protein